ncbi:hypothetical protein [Paenibacillus taichungensis]|uniref:hypothetical protein n=1 Tax=Paenibacillus taichungensis TaxID=484184 RepID=UPI0038CF9E93
MKYIKILSSIASASMLLASPATVGRGSYPSSGSTTDTALSNIIKSKMTAGTLVYIKNGALSFTNN